MSLWLKELTSVIRLRARVIATLRRRWPPSCRSGSESVGQPAVRGLAVADGEDDGIALVALHAFEVLHEELLGAVSSKKSCEFGALAERSTQSHVDPVGVLDAHGDDAERFLGPCRGVIEDEGDDAVDLGGDAVLLTGGARLLRDEFMGQALSPATPGKVVSDCRRPSRWRRR